MSGVREWARSWCAARLRRGAWVGGWWTFQLLCLPTRMIRTAVTVVRRASRVWRHPFACLSSSLRTGATAWCLRRGACRCDECCCFTVDRGGEGRQEERGTEGWRATRQGAKSETGRGMCARVPVRADLHDPRQLQRPCHSFGVVFFWPLASPTVRSVAVVDITCQDTAAAAPAVAIGAVAVRAAATNVGLDGGRMCELPHLWSVTICGAHIAV